MILVCKKERAVVDLKHAKCISIEDNYMDIEFIDETYVRVDVGELSDKEKDSLLAFLATYKDKEAVFVLDDVIKKIKGDKE